MAPSTVLLVLFCGVSLFGAAYCRVGVCYGMLGDDLPPPAEVVALFQQHNIPRMRIYFPTDQVLSVLRGSNIDLILDVPREDLPRLAADPAAAAAWIDHNVAAFSPDVAFRYIAVGNELIPGKPEAPLVFPAMTNLHAALSSRNLQDKIRVSTAVDSGVLAQSYPPSAGGFSAAAADFLRPIAQFLSANGAPLLANVYPYFSYVGNPKDISLDYALFTSPGTVVSDGAFNYQNLFDASLDAIYVALEKVGAGGVEVVVSESGWPSAGGGDAAAVGNAQVYNQNLIRHAPNGTPRRPGKEIETYVFAMFNENQKAAGTEQNFGLFYPSKQPVYPVDF